MSGKRYDALLTGLFLNVMDGKIEIMQKCSEGSEILKIWPSGSKDIETENVMKLVHHAT